jgi:hypothetical protein
MSQPSQQRQSRFDRRALLIAIRGGEEANNPKATLKGPPQDAELTREWLLGA